MKTTSLLFAFVILCFIYQVSFAQAPDWLWAKSAGGVEADVAHSVTVDGTGNVYVSGRFHSPTLTIGSVTLINKDNTGNSTDLFIAKYDSDGSMLWAKSTGENHTNDVALSLAVSTSGNIYMTGVFGGSTITFDSIVLSNPGFFLAKYDTDGNVLWAVSASNTNVCQGSSVTVDGLENIYVTGWYYDSPIIFDAIPLPNTGSADIFLVKYDSAGNVNWAKGFGGISYDLAHAVAVDTAGNTYVTGEFGSPTLVIDTITLTKTGADSSDIFIAKFNTTGNVLWASSAGGAGNEIANSVVVDSKLEIIYITGTFTSPTMTFGADVLVNVGSVDLFLAKYDTDGNDLWAKSAGGASDDVAVSVAVDALGNSFLTGYIQSSTITFGTTTLTDKGIFLAKYNELGNVIWTEASGFKSSDAANDVVVDALGNIYLTGCFYSSSITFDNVTLTNAGSGDIFLAKSGNSTGLFETVTTSNFSCYPNPTASHITIENHNPTPKTFTLSITNIQGQLLFSEHLEIDKTHTIDLTKYSNGIYFLTLQNEKENFVGKVVVKR